MFPPRVPRVFIEWLSAPGDTVYDPFSGRGTVPLEATRLGRVGCGSDANPLAVVLTAAKVAPPRPDAVLARLAALRAAYRPARAAQAPAAIRAIYHPRVLRQLCWLRDALDLRDRVDRFIMAVLLGVMHANYEPGRAVRGLSCSMPNTFAMAPRYVAAYRRAHKLPRPDVDAFALLAQKVRRLALPGAGAARGRAWTQDARARAPLAPGSVKLVFTSPPYLEVIRYGKYNWIRLWMLKRDPVAVDAKLYTSGSLARYCAFLRGVLEQLRALVAGNGAVCLVIGDVVDRRTKRRTNLADAVWENVARPAGWRRLALVVDAVPVAHKVSRIWRARAGRATRTDRILILAPPGSSTRLPALAPLRWDAPCTWAPRRPAGEGPCPSPPNSRPSRASTSSRPRRTRPNSSADRSTSTTRR